MKLTTIKKAVTRYLALSLATLCIVAIPASAAEKFTYKKMTFSVDNRTATLVSGKKFKNSKLDLNDVSNDIFEKYEDENVDVLVVGKNAFKGNNRIKEIYTGMNLGLQCSLTEIKEGAFQNCKKLESADLGNDCEVIGKNAFKGCKKLKKIYINIDIKTIGKNAFKGCPKNSVIVVSCEDKDFKKKAKILAKKLKSAGLKSGKIYNHDPD